MPNGGSTEFTVAFHPAELTPQLHVKCRQVSTACVTYQPVFIVPNTDEKHITSILGLADHKINTLLNMLHH